MSSGLSLLLMRAGLPGYNFLEDVRGVPGALRMELDGTCQGGNVSCRQSGWNFSLARLCTLTPSSGSVTPCRDEEAPRLG